ncbi:MAG TPA: hypothetical protein VGK40_08225 [Verrucomicrobiae bacterium]|jgi:hypothetical protein
MRIKGICLTMAGLALAAWLVSNQWRLSKDLDRGQSERAKIAEELASLRQQMEQDPAREKLDVAQNNLAAAEARLAAMAARVMELEKQLDRIPRIEQTVRGSGRRLTEPDVPSVPPPGGRNWGPEQATGPPDTAGAGDIPTAWASRNPNGGAEWLQLEYEKNVYVAEVRIRETHNPGAISKVTALAAGGQEIVLWEGTEQAAQAPVDFAVPVQGNVLANSIKVYLDTARVPGWNEIDAVELIGKDGSRQWAKQASASSTYADASGNGSLVR